VRVRPLRRRDQREQKGDGREQTMIFHEGVQDSRSLDSLRSLGMT
jgi:hypothetical protein